MNYELLFKLELEKNTELEKKVNNLEQENEVLRIRLNRSNSISTSYPKKHCINTIEPEVNNVTINVYSPMVLFG